MDEHTAKLLKGKNATTASQWDVNLDIRINIICHVEHSSALDRQEYIELTVPMGAVMATDYNKLVNSALLQACARLPQAIKEADAFEIVPD